MRGTRNRIGMSRDTFPVASKGQTKPWAAILLSLLGIIATPFSTIAQTVSPPSIAIGPGSPVCAGGNTTTNACIELPPSSVVNKVDVFFLFDDTGSFAGFVPTVSTIFGSLVTDLEAALPGVEFGFGVGRFEDYGGPGSEFSEQHSFGRPFLLNQPIVTAASAGGSVARDTLINTALGHTAPDDGGDDPESDIAEGLYQVATGVGFDGNGDGTTTGLAGTQVAGALSTQTSPDESGDVPAFSTLDPSVIVSGSVGGAGFRPAALKIVILATDICPVAAFNAATSIPSTISGTGSTEPVSVFACSGTTPGENRFGFVSDSKTFAGNTVVGAVVPAGARTVPATVAALNAAGIRVLGMGPGAGPTSSPGPGEDESISLSALARLTGAVDGSGNPLVFDIAGGGTPLKDAIVNAITITVSQPIDITLAASGTVPADLTVDITPSMALDVSPGGTACFDAKFTGTDSPLGSFGLTFKDVTSGAELGLIPVGVQCSSVLGALDHFQCYKTRLTQSSGPWLPRVVSLSDEFGTDTFLVRRPQDLCTPADKNGEGINDAVTHLESYKISSPGHARHDVKVEDQLGTLLLTTTKAKRLLVPTAESLTGPPEPLDPEHLDVDHFKCYQIESTAGDQCTADAPLNAGGRCEGEEECGGTEDETSFCVNPRFPKRLQVTVEDQFGEAARVFEVMEPKRLCNPVSVDGGEIKHPDAHLMCYDVRQAAGQSKLPRVTGIFVNNDFGPQQLDMKGGQEALPRRETRQQLCLPSRQTDLTP